MLIRGWRMAIEGWKTVGPGGQKLRWSSDERRYLLFKDLDPLCLEGKGGHLLRWASEEELGKAGVQVGGRGGEGGELSSPSIEADLGGGRVAVGMDGQVAKGRAHGKADLRVLHQVGGADGAAGLLGGQFAPALRVLYSPLLSTQDQAALARARALVYFHQTHRYCGSCGGLTKSGKKGKSRSCGHESPHHDPQHQHEVSNEGGSVKSDQSDRLQGGCGKEWFPRVEPACIMLVRSRELDACLVGRQATWPEGRYSVLAGFVDSGETVEEAVEREVMEEAGVRVLPNSFRFIGTQFWPFPHSLMLGCAIDAASTDITVGENELQHAMWLPRSRLSWLLGNHPRTGDIKLPPPQAISHRLLAAFARGDLD